MLFFELLQVAVGQRELLSFAPSHSEWSHLYQLAQQQGLVGVCYMAVRRLPQEQCPNGSLLTDWTWKSQRILDKNRLLNRRSADACEGLGVRGFVACLLKGQGNALMYGDLSMCRQPGDIDVWCVPRERPEYRAKCRTIEEVRRHYPKTRLRFHHIDLPALKDVEVEMHFIPIYLNNPFLNRRLNHWFREQRVYQMSHLVLIDGREVAVPTLQFNALYQLLHIYKHIFEEGIGLRQLLDYYFLLKEFHANETDAAELQRMISRLKLDRLAGSVMYVLAQVFAMPQEWMIAPQRRDGGLMMLSEIMQAGNFGRYDVRYQREGSGICAELHRFWRKTKRNLIFAYYFPHEGLWEPLFRLYHFFWRTLRLWRFEK